VPHKWRKNVIGQFTADVRAATRLAMKKLHRDVWKRHQKAIAGARPPSKIVAVSAPSEPPKPVVTKKPATRRKPLLNVTDLVDGKDFISSEHAAKWFGTTDRNLRKLAAMGRIEIRGEGQNRKVAVASLRRYFGV